MLPIKPILHQNRAILIIPHHLSCFDNKPASLRSTRPSWSVSLVPLPLLLVVGAVNDINEDHNLDTDIYVIKIIWNVEMLMENWTHLSWKEGKHLSNDGVESLADLGLFVHLHVQPVWHLVVLQRIFHCQNTSIIQNQTEGCSDINDSLWNKWKTILSS